MYKTTSRFLACIACIFFLAYCTDDEPDIDFSNPESFTCNSNPLICSRPDSLGGFGERDCDDGGISTFHECIANTNFNDPSDDCQAAVRAKVDICFLLQIDQDSVERGFRTDHVLSDQDCDGGGLTNYEECINGFDPIRENDGDELNNLVDLNEINAYLESRFTSEISIDTIDSIVFMEEILTDKVSEETFITVRKESGVVCLIAEDAMGETPSIQSTITYNYTSSYLDKICMDFDPSCIDVVGDERLLGTEQSQTALLSDLIFGLQEGLILMPANTNATILIPSKEAYGSLGAFEVPSYSVLIFDVELLSFE